MSIRFENDYSKQWLARKGPTKVFGKDVDHRESMKNAEAIAWFDNIWTKLEGHVRDASPCDLDFVRERVTGSSKDYIKAHAKHREFTLASCQFICQLTDEATCDQLWFIPSTSGDPRTLYVKFENVPTKEAFDETAKRLGWQVPEELAEKLLLDFLSSVNRTEYPKGTVLPTAH